MLKVYSKTYDHKATQFGVVHTNEIILYVGLSELAEMVCKNSGLNVSIIEGLTIYTSKNHAKKIREILSEYGC